MKNQNLIDAVESKELEEAFRETLAIVKQKSFVDPKDDNSSIKKFLNKQNDDATDKVEA